LALQGIFGSFPWDPPPLSFPRDLEQRFEIFSIESLPYLFFSFPNLGPNCFFSPCVKISRALPMSPQSFSPFFFPLSFYYFPPPWLIVFPFPFPESEESFVTLAKCRIASSGSQSSPRSPSFSPWSEKHIQFKNSPLRSSQRFPFFFFFFSKGSRATFQSDGDENRISLPPPATFRIAVPQVPRSFSPEIEVHPDRVFSP